MGQWSEYTGLASDWAQWHLAQQAGRQAEFLTPQQAVEAMTLPEEFEATVFAAEPMISQPMAFCWDARGRLWVAENRDYETRQTGFSADGSSRILILEDTTGDGLADSRKVFLEGIRFRRRSPWGWAACGWARRPIYCLCPTRTATIAPTSIRSRFV